MNKKIVTLILVILVSLCFLSIVVADNATNDDNNSTKQDSTVNQDDDNYDNDDDNDNDNDSDNDTDDKSKKGYILAKGNGNNIPFSDGFRGFILDYSKSPASSGDEFKSVSASKASNSNTLKQAIVECYRQSASGQIGSIMASFIKSGSAGGKVGAAVAASNEKIGNHAVVKINNHTEAVFNFEVLESVSGNVSDYFAYTVSFRSISDDSTNQTNNSSNVTNITNTTNITNMTALFDNETNMTLLDELYDYLAFLFDLLYDAWEPIIETLINDFLMIANALQELATMIEEFITEIQSLMDGLEKLINMLESAWKELLGLLNLLNILLNAIQQLINFIMSILNFIAHIISALIALIQQLLNLLYGLINFIMSVINQILSLIQAILDFLKSVGSFLMNVIENAVIIIGAFVLVTIGAFVYNRIK